MFEQFKFDDHTFKENYTIVLFYLLDAKLSTHVPPDFKKTIEENGVTQTVGVFRKSGCKTPYQCCCKDKGVADDCWYLCTDGSRHMKASSHCDKWMKLISECIYCTSITEGSTYF